MTDVNAGTGPEPSNEIQVVLSTKMIETVNVPIQPLLVRFAVPEDWFLDEVKPPETVAATPAPSPAPSPQSSGLKMHMKTAHLRPISAILARRKD